MNRRYALERMLDTTPTVADSRTFGGGGTDPASILKGRLQGLVRQRDQIQKRSAFLNTSPLGETSPQDVQDMADLGQSIAALGQKVANPTKPLQFAPEPRVSTTPNATQYGYAMDRARTAAAGAQQQQAQARDLEAGNIENELSIANQMADPTFGNMDVGRARYNQHTRRAALARQYSGTR